MQTMFGRVTRKVISNSNECHKLLSNQPKVHMRGFDEILLNLPNFLSRAAPLPQKHMLLKKIDYEIHVTLHILHADKSILEMCNICKLCIYTICVFFAVFQIRKKRTNIREYVSLKIEAKH